VERGRKRVRRELTYLRIVDCRRSQSTLARSCAGRGAAGGHPPRPRARAGGRLQSRRHCGADDRTLVAGLAGGDGESEACLARADARARRRVLLGVWENLGRTVAEMPHVGALRRTADGPGWECEDDTQFRALRDHGGPAILFSGHLAHWEIGLPVAASLGLAVTWFDRAASNPAADAAIQDMRRRAAGADVPMFAKGSAGAREAFAHFRRGGVLGMLVDQKLNEGLAVPFFGRPAMTTPALAQFALRFRCPSYRSIRCALGRRGSG
jgi:Bacterial lipid A biosynthesis acyltransferase